MSIRISMIKSTTKDYGDKWVDGKLCNLDSNEAGVAFIR